LSCLVLENALLCDSGVDVERELRCTTGVARRWSKGREGREVSVVDHRWICLESCERKGTGHWNRYAHGRTEEKYVTQRACVDVRSEAGKKNSPNRYELYLVFFKCSTNTLSFYVDCRLSLLFYHVDY